MYNLPFTMYNGAALGRGNYADDSAAKLYFVNGKL